MGEGQTSMEGINQNIRPSRQPSNSPTLQGNSSKSVTKPKGGHQKSQKFGKSPANGQQNVYSNKKKGRNYQNPQKQGYLADKRPPSRGYKQTESYQQLSVEDKDLDLDYDFPVTSKKDQTSLNHLLNFTFAPREQVQYMSSGKKKGSALKGSSFNKEQFLQANCQFVVQDGEDYSINNVDPDAIVDWCLIEQVRVRCTEVPSCPICLYPPTAAQVTRCGHIYCWSCVLHYLSLSEKTWQKCPICYESIHKNDLKSVMAVSDHKHIHGQEITLSLMKRLKGSVRALPASKWVEGQVPPHLGSDEVEMKFSKFIKATPQQLLKQMMAQVRSELDSQLLEMDNDKSDEKQFVNLAIDEFQKREQRLLEMCGKHENSTTEIQENTTEIVCDVHTNDNMDKATTDDREVEEKVEQSHDLSSGGETFAEKTSSRDGCSRTSISSDDSFSSNKSNGSFQFYYFYQAEDGQQIYLHPLNVRCLIREYGSLENCPETITGRIIEMECLTQTQEVRRRYAYLGHLPLTCEFAICELDLKPPILSRSTLNFFKDDLRKRRTRRQKKAKDEARHDHKCRTNFDSYTGIVQPRTKYLAEETPDLSSEHDFPQQVSSDAVWVASSPPTSGPWSTSSPSDKDILQPGQSFAEALSTGKWSTQPKTKMRTEAGRINEKKALENSDEEGDIVPSFQSAFNDALMLADWNLNVESVAKDNRSESGGSGKKSKRKSNKRVLFSTGSSRKL